MGAAAAPIGKAIVAFFASKAAGVVIVRTVLIQLALGALAKHWSRQRTPQPPINVTVRGTIERRRLLYGRRRAGGVIVFWGTSGTNQNDLWYVVVMAGRQIAAMTDVWIDQRRIATADINGSGSVTGGTFANRALIKRHLGTGAQTADPDLEPNFTAWTTNHRLRGCPYVVARFTRDDGVFPQGAPQSVGALCDGHLIYDPRLDSTNGGVGSHRRDNPSTWAFSRNPALITRDYISGGSVVNDQATRMIFYGLREIDSRILDSFTIAAANICDEVLTGGVAPPSGNQSRYNCDLEVSCGELRREILGAILASMAGEAVYEKGTWRIYAGAYDVPTHTFTQAALDDELEVDDIEGGDTRYNAVSATYIDSAKQYVEQTTPFRTDSAYETQDGERLQKVIDLRGVTDVYQAQRICEIELRRSRMMRKVAMPGGLNLLKVGKHETFNYSHEHYAWSSRIFRCFSRQFEFNQDAGRVTIIAQREDPGVYADMLTADYQTGTSSTDVFTLDGPDAPTNLTIERFGEQLLLSWSMPAFRGQTLYTEVWEYTAVTPFASATLVTTVSGNAVVIKQFSRDPRFYWIRHRNAAGQVSATFPATNGQQAQVLDGIDEVFFDSFEHQDYARHYVLDTGSPAITYPADGESGGRVLQAQGKAQLVSNRNLTYAPSDLLVMEVRARMTVAPSDAARDNFYAGAVGYASDGTTKIQTNGGSSGGVEHYFVANALDFGAVTLGQWQTIRGYLSGHSASPSPAPSPNIADPMEMYGSGGTVVRFIRPTIVLNVEDGDGTMQVDYIRLWRVSSSLDIAPNSASQIPVSVNPVDGSIFYAATTQPAVEGAGINGLASYTAAANNASVKVLVSAMAQARISNTTSGTAIGEAQIKMIVQINSVTVYQRTLGLEGYAAGNQYAQFADSKAFEVPAGQQIQVFLTVGRSFSSGGASPAQTIFWRAASLNLQPLIR